MQNVVAMIGQPEIIGLLVILVTMLGARKLPELLNGLRHDIHEFKQATREVQSDVAEALETKPAGDGGKTFRLHEFLFWLIVSLVVAMYALALGLR